MDLKVFSVLDSKAQFFGQPFFAETEAAAIRSFGDAVNDSSNKANQWHSHPEDFQLFVIGAFDNSNGVLVPCTPKALVMASSLRYTGAAPNEPLNPPLH